METRPFFLLRRFALFGRSPAANAGSFQENAEKIRRQIAIISSFIGREEDKENIFKIFVVKCCVAPKGLI
jgi:hypothetical protein